MPSCFRKYAAARAAWIPDTQYLQRRIVTAMATPHNRHTPFRSAAYGRVR